MKILSIDTSCDETAAAVTDERKILSNIVWSQASAHAKFGGVMPSLAQRMHEERIDFVIEKALKTSRTKIENLDAVAVTIGPGLSIALGVGIKKAKEISEKYNKKLIAVNHLEGHILSPLANNKEGSQVKYPALGLVVSGGNTQLILIKKIGDYEVLAETTDDALGEALDKSARMLGLGYPGGALLEKLAREGNSKTFTLPVPIAGQEQRKIFTYSGLKTAMFRKIEEVKSKNGELTKQDIYDLAAAFQNTAFTHLIRVITFILRDSNLCVHDLLVGGGVTANVELRKRLRKLGKDYSLKVHFPYTNKLYGDNAAMIGVAANFKMLKRKFVDPNKIDRIPNLRVDIVS